MKKIQKISKFFLLMCTVVACSTTDILEEQFDEGEINSVAAQGGVPLNLTKTIPAGANSWVIGNPSQDDVLISPAGIHNWTQTSDVIRSYFSLSNAGELHVGLTAKSPNAPSTIRVTVNGESLDVVLSSASYGTVNVGKFNAVQGYNYIEIQGIQKSGAYIGDINDILIGGPAAAGNVNFVPLSNQYFGRRGPSVNIRYPVAAGKDVTYFYNEVTVPVGEDKVGSYFMTNGHLEGYFGMQVNSETERRILFSIWSAFETDNPNSIPESARVIELERGENVTVQNFGNEGSGKQSIKFVNWKAGTTYKFLLKGTPSVNNSTDYTGWFFDPEVGSWQIIASFRRPQTFKHLTNLYSFVENFVPNTGYQKRSARFGNQWVYDTTGNWSELNQANFGYDATASSGDRLDYGASVVGSQFSLENCGFFNGTINPGTTLTRSTAGTPPNIPFISSGGKTYYDRANWTISSYSSQEVSGEGTNGRAAQVLDNNASTYWHSCWSSCNPQANYPHELVIDMKSQKSISGIGFAQRQSLSRSVNQLEILTSSSTNGFQSRGVYSLANATGLQDVNFSQNVSARYIKIRFINAHDSQQFAAMAEIAPFVE